MYFIQIKNLYRYKTTIQFEVSITKSNNKKQSKQLPLNQSQYNPKVTAQAEPSLSLPIIESFEWWLDYDALPSTIPIQQRSLLYSVIRIYILCRRVSWIIWNSK